MLADGPMTELSLEVEVIDSALHCRLDSHILQPRSIEAGEPPDTSMRHRAMPIGALVKWHVGLAGQQVYLTVPFTAAAKLFRPLLEGE